MMLNALVITAAGLNERFRSSAELVSEAVVGYIALGLSNEFKKTSRFNRRCTVFY